ncbi:NHLP leader peptide family natural product precursor [Nostoc sp. FACHB-87]|uniref:NHLP leader peptide family RiPP precursor n=1 Tax=Nostocales TaxID=1161 RepID=UPI0016827413|nr:MULTISPECIES: NHLP leader peptide family RiPP precursor [Nostocales]MBD2299666.1 NHLP leader peptide family natural product precursor [Nostoc sp. FACHB-190]MBD2457486.1 NHLP leader peptide family natural product precursor [Nostoc sp. FACHB-87]MBD2477546.1 NHLP leader peptide family natural product precursor [Anabaena sp. FACHB-83]MBD2489573.1 NHLP leader peptide family natural product precursor [Aulosira sp. FACHB-615]
MTTNSEGLSPESLQELIIAKAIEDPAYKQRLLSDARAVLAEELGADLPENLSVEVLQQSPKQLYLVLPIDIDELVRDGIISQPELEAVAGASISFVSKLIASTAAQVSVFAGIEHTLKKWQQRRK